MNYEMSNVYFCSCDETSVVPVLDRICLTKVTFTTIFMYTLNCFLIQCLPKKVHSYCTGLVIIYYAQ